MGSSERLNAQNRVFKHQPRRSKPFLSTRPPVSKRPLSAERFLMITKYSCDVRPTDFVDRLIQSRYPKKQPKSKTSSAPLTSGTSPSVTVSLTDDERSNLMGLRHQTTCLNLRLIHRLRRDRRERLVTLQTGDGRLLPDHLKAQVRRELDRLELLLEQIKAVEAERDILLAAQQAPAAMLLDIKGIGPEFAAILWSEGLFRHFDNRRQVASYAGLAPTPWQSGSVDREQGVSKAGNPRLRTTLIQLAWLWLSHQPQSALALWFEERVRRNGDRLKKTTIVALARKLLVALWKYVTAGVVIEGAVMKAA